MSESKGALIIFEGCGCVGKSSVINAVAADLEVHDIPHVVIMNHANSPFTSALRKTLADCGQDASEHSKVFVYAAIWNELYTKTVKPALDAGKVVLMDRYIPTTYFFQAPAGDGVITSIMSNTEHMIADACIYMTCEWEEIQRRIANRLSVRMDRYGEEFIRDSLQYLPQYEAAAKMFSDRFLHIDTTNLSKEKSALTVIDMVDQVLRELNNEQITT